MLYFLGIWICIALEDWLDLPCCFSRIVPAWFFYFVNERKLLDSFLSWARLPGVPTAWVCCRRLLPSLSHPVPVTSSKAYRDNVRFAIGIRFTVSPPKESNVLHVWRVILQYGVDWYDKHLFMVSLWVRCPCRICTCLRSWNMVQKFMVLHVLGNLASDQEKSKKHVCKK